MVKPLARSGVLASALLCTALTLPASAQFGFFGQSEVSQQDVYDTVASHGFRLAGPLFRSGRVYVADVIDRRQRRERLIISASSGQIVQRFFVDVSGPSRRPGYGDGLPGEPNGEALPQRVPLARADSGDNFFSRLVRGWGDDAPPRPPVGLDNGGENEAVMPRVPARPPRVTRPRQIEPRVVTRSEDAPITSSPLPPPGQGSVPVTPTPTPAQSSPAAASPAAPASNTRATTVVTDPLRIPGKKEPDTLKSTTAAATTKAPAASAAPKPPSDKAAPAGDVPVAPLE
jgi:hypothetical protein